MFQLIDSNFVRCNRFSYFFHHWKECLYFQ